MTELQWKAFCTFKQNFLAKIDEWNCRCPELLSLQQAAAKAAKTPDYPFETPIVYNRDLDRLTKDDDIKLIVIGDNPGKDEQLAKNNKYLVGLAGKIAEGFFRRHQEFGVDFRKNVIILNKTPVHSAKTNQLNKIVKEGGQKVADLILESQLWMAEQTAALHSALCNGAQSGAEKTGVSPELWLVGYAELKGKGIFVPYKNKLKETYSALASDTKTNAWNQVYVFQHFSMNRFSINLDELTESEHWENYSLEQKVYAAGNLHKTEIFS